MDVNRSLPTFIRRVHRGLSSDQSPVHSPWREGGEGEGTGRERARERERERERERI